MKILIVEDEDDLRAVMGFYIESELGIEAIFAGSLKEARAVLNQVSSLDAVVCDFALGDGTAEDVYLHLKGVNPGIPFILCGSYGPETYPGFVGENISGWVPKDQVFGRLKEILEDVLSLQSKAASQSELKGPAYMRVRTDTVLKLGLLSCDLFIKLPQDRFIRVYRSGDVFEAEDFERFREKKVAFLYFRTRDREALFQRLQADLVHLSNLRTAPLGTVLRVSTSALEVIGDFTRRFGFTPEIQELTRANVEFAVKNIQQSGTLGPLFQELILDSESYVASHGVALAYLCCGIASLMGWRSDVTFYKLTLAAFLHDLLISNQSIAEIQTVAELNKRRSDFTPDEIRSWLEHPKSCADLIRGLREMPLDVDTVILQHHERPEGSGFPAQLNNLTITPLSAVFILSHELLAEFYRRDPLATDARPLVEFLNGLSDDYNQGYFKNLLRVVTQALIIDQI
jgi:response regulator RpfG family c-di-GMP phosphodiesterase